MTLNDDRSFKFDHICAAYRCYQGLCDGKKKEAKQSIIDSFFKPKTLFLFITYFFLLQIFYNIFIIIIKIKRKVERSHEVPFN